MDAILNDSYGYQTSVWPLRPEEAGGVQAAQDRLLCEKIGLSFSQVLFENRYSRVPKEQEEDKERIRLQFDYDDRCSIREV